MIEVKRQGFSLLEACISITIFSGCLLVIVGLFQRSLLYSSQVREQYLGQQVALDVLHDLKSWSTQRAEGVANYEQLSRYRPSTVSMPSGYDCRVVSEPIKRATPCENFESEFPESGRRLLRNSLQRVQIEVSWHQGASRYVLTSLIGEPPRPQPSNCRITISGAPTRLAVDEERSVSASVSDSNGKPLDDVQLQWSAQPVDGVGALVSQSRDGSTAKFVNQARDARGSKFYTGGHFKIAARTVYCGREIIATSDSIELAKP